MVPSSTTRSDETSRACTRKNRVLPLFDSERLKVPSGPVGTTPQVDHGPSAVTSQACTLTSMPFSGRSTG